MKMATIPTKLPKFTRRQHRALEALWPAKQMREAIDRAAGCSNGPQLIKGLIEKGIDIRCVLIDSVDRDGRACKPGRYELTDEGRDTLVTMGWAYGQRA